MRTVLDNFVTVFSFETAGTRRVIGEIEGIEKQMNKTVASMGRAAMGWGMAFGYVTSSASKLEHQIISIATQAEISTDKMYEYNKALLETAKAHGVSNKSMREGVQEFVEKTGDIEKIMGQTELLADMLKGLRMKPVDAGDLLAVFSDLGLVEDEWRETINRISFIAKKGSIPIDKLAGVMGRAMASGKLTGSTDMVEMTAELTAFMQIINRVTRAPKRAMTAMENFTHDFSNNYEKLSEVTGMDITGNEGIFEVMKKMSSFYKSGGDTNQLKDYFGGGVLKAEELRNVLKELDRGFGRRGSRGAGAAMMFGDVAEGLIEASKAAGDVAGDDAGQQFDSIATSVDLLKNALEEVTLVLIEGGGLKAALDALVSVLQTASSIIGLLPNWLINGALAFIMWRKVILGVIAIGLRPLISSVLKFSTGLGISKAVMSSWNWTARNGTGTMLRLKYAITAAKNAVLAFNFAVSRNVFAIILQVIMEIILWLPVLITMFKSLFGKNKIDADITESISAELKPASALSPSQYSNDISQVANVTVNMEGGNGTADDARDGAGAALAEAKYHAVNYFDSVYQMEASVA